MRDDGIERFTAHLSLFIGQAASCLRNNIFVIKRGKKTAKNRLFFGENL